MEQGSNRTFSAGLFQIERSEQSTPVMMEVGSIGSGAMFGAQLWLKNDLTRYLKYTDHKELPKQGQFVAFKCVWVVRVR